MCEQQSKTSRTGKRAIQLAGSAGEGSSGLDLAFLFLSSFPPRVAWSSRRQSHPVMANGQANSTRGLMCRSSAMLFFHFPEGKWSGRWDLNPRPLGPEPSALPSYATPRQPECGNGAPAGGQLQTVSEEKICAPRFAAPPSPSLPRAGLCARMVL